MQLEAFQLVLLRRPKNAPSYDEATLDRIQGEHVAFMTRVREEGPLVTNGPVIDQRDESLRGIAIYNTNSLEVARRIAESDPAVLAGRLTAEIMTWFSPPHTMVQTGSIVTIDDS